MGRLVLLFVLLLQICVLFQRVDGYYIYADNNEGSFDVAMPVVFPYYRPRSSISLTFPTPQGPLKYFSTNGNELFVLDEEFVYHMTLGTNLLLEEKSLLLINTTFMVLNPFDYDDIFFVSNVGAIYIAHIEARSAFRIANPGTPVHSIALDPVHEKLYYMLETGTVYVINWDGSHNELFFVPSNQMTYIERRYPILYDMNSTYLLYGGTNNDGYSLYGITTIGSRQLFTVANETTTSSVNIGYVWHSFIYGISTPVGNENGFLWRCRIADCTNTSQTVLPFVLRPSSAPFVYNTTNSSLYYITSDRGALVRISDGVISPIVSPSRVAAMVGNTTADDTDQYFGFEVYYVTDTGAVIGQFAAPRTNYKFFFRDSSFPSQLIGTIPIISDSSQNYYDTDTTRYSIAYDPGERILYVTNNKEAGALYQFPLGDITPTAVKSLGNPTALFVDPYSARIFAYDTLDPCIKVASLAVSGVQHVFSKFMDVYFKPDSIYYEGKSSTLYYGAAHEGLFKYVEGEYVAKLVTLQKAYIPLAMVAVGDGLLPEYTLLWLAADLECEVPNRCLTINACANPGICMPDARVDLSPYMENITDPTISNAALLYNENTLFVIIRPDIPILHITGIFGCCPVVSSFYTFPIGRTFGNVMLIESRSLVIPYEDTLEEIDLDTGVLLYIFPNPSSSHSLVFAFEESSRQLYYVDHNEVMRCNFFLSPCENPTLVASMNHSVISMLAPSETSLYIYLSNGELLTSYISGHTTRRILPPTPYSTPDRYTLLIAHYSTTLIVANQGIVNMSTTTVDSDSGFPVAPFEQYYIGTSFISALSYSPDENLLQWMSGRTGQIQFLNLSLNESYFSIQSYILPNQSDIPSQSVGLLYFPDPVLGYIVPYERRSYRNDYIIAAFATFAGTITLVGVFILCYFSCCKFPLPVNAISESERMRRERERNNNSENNVNNNHIPENSNGLSFQASSSSPSSSSRVSNNNNDGNPNDIELSTFPTSSSSVPKKDFDLPSVYTDGTAITNEHGEPRPQNENEFSGYLCAICDERKVNTAFTCGHVTCDDCARKLKLCPFCKSEIKTRIRLYF